MPLLGSPDLIHESECHTEILDTEGALSVRILQAVLVESEEEESKSCHRNHAEGTPTERACRDQIQQDLR